MGVRRSLLERLARPLEPRIRELVEAALSSRTFVRPGELEELEQRLTRDPRPELAERLAALEKRVDMALGAFQASSAQAVEARELAKAARNEARQASQQATTARATAESIEDGLSVLEERVGALIENLGPR